MLLLQLQTLANGMVLKIKTPATIARATFPESDFAPFLGKVYRPDDDSFLLIDAILKEEEFLQKQIKPTTVLEIGMGSEIVLNTAAKLLQQQSHDLKFFATDINPDAIQATRKCAEINNIHGLELVQTNMADKLKDRLRNKVDLLVTNPPFEPAPVEDIGHASVKSAWSAGPTGRAIIDKIIPELPQLMSSTGVAYMACIRKNDVPNIIQIMENNGFYAKIVLKKNGTTSSTQQPTYYQYVLRFSKTNYE